LRTVDSIFDINWVKTPEGIDKSGLNIYCELKDFFLPMICLREFKGLLSILFPEKGTKVKKGKILLGSILVIALFFLSSCTEKKQIPTMTLPVEVAPVVQKTVPVELRAIANVQAYSTVTVKSKVGGELIAVHFTEGEDVRKGELLFTIDPRPYEAAFKQAEANL
jgi:hypothetical protein